MKHKSKKGVRQKKILFWQAATLIGLVAMVVVVFVSLLVAQNSQELRSSAFETSPRNPTQALAPKAWQNRFDSSQLITWQLPVAQTNQGLLLAIETTDNIGISRVELSNGSSKQLLEKVDGLGGQAAIYWLDSAPRGGSTIEVQYSRPTSSKVAYALLPRPIGKPVVVVPGPGLSASSTQLLYSSTPEPESLLTAGLSSLASDQTNTGWWQPSESAQPQQIADGVWLSIPYAPVSEAEWQLGGDSATGNGATIQLSRSITGALPLSVLMPDNPVCVGVRLLGRQKDVWIGSKLQGSQYQTTLNQTLKRGVYTLEARGYSDEACTLVTSKQILNLIVTN